MTCPSCQRENRPDSRFCLACGGALPAVCAGCERELPADAHFCDSCGRRVGPEPKRERAPRPEPDPRSYTPKHLVDRILRSKSALEGERKQVTVLFADVKASMELSERGTPAGRDMAEPAREPEPLDGGRRVPPTHNRHRAVVGGRRHRLRHAT